MVLTGRRGWRKRRGKKRTKSRGEGDGRRVVRGRAVVVDKTKGGTVVGTWIKDEQEEGAGAGKEGRE